MECPYCHKDNTFIYRSTVLKYYEIDKILDNGEIILGKSLDHAKFDGTIDVNIQCQSCEKLLQRKHYDQREILLGNLVLLYDDLDGKA